VLVDGGQKLWWCHLLEQQRGRADAHREEHQSAQTKREGEGR
jgi:hypothetical protein